jgi:hypothetical protein
MLFVRIDLASTFPLFGVRLIDSRSGRRIPLL